MATPHRNDPSRHIAPSRYIDPTDMDNTAPYDTSAWRGIWADLRFVYRDACLEGQSPRLEEAIRRLPDYQLEILRASARILVIATLDEKLSRTIRSKG